MAVMAGPWRLDRLAAAAGETEDRLRWYGEVGLLHRQANGEFDPDSLHRLRLIQFVRSRGVGDEKLACARWLVIVVIPELCHQHEHSAASRLT